MKTRCWVAFVRDCCKHGELSRSWSWEEREWDVPTWFWTEFTVGRNSSQDWVLGRFSGDGRTARGNGAITLTGLHFHKQTLDALLGMGGDTSGQPTAIDEAESRRGRRSTYDWQTASSAVWGQLHRGDLRADTQADVERALISILRHGDHEPSESTVRPYAKTIFEEFLKP